MRTLRILSILAVMAPGLAAHAEIVDQVLATVDTEAILQSEIMMEIVPRLAELQSTAPNEAAFNEAADALIREALDQAIDTKLLLREALRAGLEVEEAMVDERLRELRRMYDSPDQFNRELEAAGETLGDLRVRLRKQTLARGMAARKLNEFERRVAVSESDVAQYYQDNQSEFTHPERLRLRQIFLPVDDNAEAEVVKARMGEILREVQEGGDFGEVARAYSKGPNAERGGVIGWVARGDLVEVLESAAFELSQGGISEVLRTPGGYHILKLEERQSEGKASLEDVRQHIEPRLRAQAAEERYARWLQELRNRSRVRVFY